MARDWTPDSWRGLPILQVPDYPDQAKLDAAEKTKHTYKGTIQEQSAHISVLQNEVATLRAAIVRSNIGLSILSTY